MQAVFLLGIIVAPTLGPTLGGWITDNYTWNWCFFINVPIGILSVFLVSSFLADPPGIRQRPTSVDFFGIGLLAVGLASLQYVLEEGQQDDWFSDAWIVRFSIISAVCLSIMLWWELSPRNTAPVVDFRVLKNRDLSCSIFLFVALGFGLYGGTYLFPLFAQNLLGFSPTTTGLMLLPGGLGTACSAMLCGRLLNGPKPLVDPRALIFLGVGLFFMSMWRMGHLSLAAGEPDVRLALFFRGFGLGFLFAPINNVAYGNIDPRIAQQASGLINLARQLGGSFGIAILGTYLTNQTQFHRVNLVARTYPGNPALDQTLQMYQANFMAHGMAANVAQQAALKALDLTISQQASMLAYNDSWIFILIAFAVTSPAILLLRKPRGAAAAVDAH